MTCSTKSITNESFVSSTPKKVHENKEEVQNDPDLIKTVKDTANEIIADVIREAENSPLNLDDSLKIAVKKSEEAFSFLENEDDATPIRTDIDHNDLFIQKESENYVPENKDVIETHEKVQVENKENKSKNKSNIPKIKTKEKYLKDEKDLDVLLSQENNENISAHESDILSRIPVASKPIKVKTIKKHSKDPLKEFVKMVNADGSWDESKLDTTIYEQTYTTTEPDGLTTTTTIEYMSSPEITKTTTIEYSTNQPETNNTSPKSKIPILLNDSKVSSPSESQKEMCDSDSDTDSRQSPPLRGILKKSSMRTLGSSSGSDIALHEAGGELSDDDTGKLIYLSF